MFAPGYFGVSYFAPGYWPPGEGVIPPEPPATVPAGGGRRRRHKGYPRRIMVGGELYWVQSPEEERALLRAYIASLRVEAREQAAEQGATSPAVQRTRKLIVRQMARLEAVDERERSWLDVLRAEDEDLLLVLLH